MDPRANIKRQCEIAVEIVNTIDSRPSTDGVDLADTELLNDIESVTIDLNEDIANLANELAELVLVLDEWRSQFRSVYPRRK